MLFNNPEAKIEEGGEEKHRHGDRISRFPVTDGRAQVLSRLLHW